MGHLKTQTSICTMYIHVPRKVDMGVVVLLCQIHLCANQHTFGILWLCEELLLISSDPAQKPQTQANTLCAHTFTSGKATHQHQNECMPTQVRTLLRLTQLCVRHVDHPAQGLQHSTVEFSHNVSRK